MNYEINLILLNGVLWCIPWYIYNYFIRTEKYNPMGTVFLRKPFIIDGWTIGHLFIYFSGGMILSDYWKLVLVLSVSVECFEYIVGWRSNWIKDPITNLIGYFLGNLFSVTIQWHWLYFRSTTYLLGFLLYMLFYVNRPAMMKNGKHFV